MNETYLDIHIAVPPDEQVRQGGQVREILPAALSEFAFEGFAEDDLGIHCFIKKKEWKESIESVIKDIAEQFNLPFIQYLSTTEIKHKNWNEEWEKTIQPIYVSEKFVITPSWHSVEDKDNTVIIIDPKMTFGTGYHETTRLMIRLMEQYLSAKTTVLDVGTGTGILAIVAAKLGATHTIGIDIDEWSLENGIENAQRNNVQDKIEIRIGSMEVVQENNFDIILANIIRNTILELIDLMLAKLSHNGKILFSGLLTSDREVIEQALHKRNFKVISVIQENDWIGMAAERQ